MVRGYNQSKITIEHRGDIVAHNFSVLNHGFNALSRRLGDLVPAMNRYGECSSKNYMHFISCVNHLVRQGHSSPKYSRFRVTLK